MDDRLTIVGPGPADRGQGIPARVNIEALLLMAKYDDPFRELLLSDREAALEQSGIKFSASEKSLLAKISPGKLLTGIEEFSINGISRESLPSWREAAAIILLVMTVIVSTACMSSPDAAGRMAHDKGCAEPWDSGAGAYESGWCDEDTFRMTGVGAPSEKETDIEKRKEMALKAAILMAQYRIIEKFIGARIEGGGIMSDAYNDEYNRSMEKFRTEMKSLVLNGKAIAVKWDENQVCTVVFQIGKPGLKKWVMSSE